MYTIYICFYKGILSLECFFKDENDCRHVYYTIGRREAIRAEKIESKYSHPLVDTQLHTFILHACHMHESHNVISITYLQDAPLPCQFQYGGLQWLYLVDFSYWVYWY